MRLTKTLLVALGATIALSAFTRAGAVAIDDAAIVGIFDAANTWDINTGSLAAKKGARADVRAFGAHLAADHEAVQKQARALATKLGVTPTPVPADFPLLLDYQATMKKLNSLSGPAFDSAFLEHEIAYHKAVINAVTTQFLPAIKNAELKKFVEDVAPAFQAHLAQAEALLAKKQ
jgi:putative membrane protein